MSNWENYSDYVSVLSDNEAEDVSGGWINFAIMGGIAAFTWTAGYTMGSDRANRDNRKK